MASLEGLLHETATHCGYSYHQLQSGARETAADWGRGSHYVIWSQRSDSHCRLTQAQLGTAEHLGPQQPTEMTEVDRVFCSHPM